MKHPVPIALGLFVVVCVILGAIWWFTGGNAQTEALLTSAPANTATVVKGFVVQELKVQGKIEQHLGSTLQFGRTVYVHVPKDPEGSNNGQWEVENDQGAVCYYVDMSNPDFPLATEPMTCTTDTKIDPGTDFSVACKTGEENCRFELIRMLP